jgi:hypothetical protein
MFFTQKNMFKPCFKQKTWLFILFFGLKKNVALPADMYIHVFKF